MNSPHQFSRHYTRDEAQALLPQIKGWLKKLTHLDERLQKAAARVEQLVRNGYDRGGTTVEEYLELQVGCLEIMANFEQRQIIVKDVQRGLVDFPAVVGGREVFLCWEQGEERIEFWHDIDDGYAGRERL